MNRKCDRCDKPAKWNYQKVWTRFQIVQDPAVSQGVLYQQDNEFDCCDVEEPIDQYNLHLCDACADDAFSRMAPHGEDLDAVIDSLLDNISEELSELSQEGATFVIDRLRERLSETLPEGQQPAATETRAILEARDDTPKIEEIEEMRME